MKQFVVDAFTDKVFGGNPAAVCVMEEWISEELMQKITIENNLSETAFTVKEGDSYRLRWFTPGGEIDLCGHATLATAYVITNYYEKNANKITFNTMSGELIVLKKNDLFEMDFPSFELKKVDVTAEIEEALGIKPLEAFLSRDLVCILETEEQVYNIHPNLDRIEKLEGTLVHVTAKGKEYDCVSRSFAPKLRIPEDPVCGSGHCHIIPLWAEKLHKNELVAYQASSRGGVLYCQHEGLRTKLSGKAVLYSIAELYI